MPDTELALSRRRLPRLTRDAAPPALRLTARDIGIVRAVARFRFLSSEQITRLGLGSSQQTLRRLRLLFDHAYLDRPHAQIAQLAHVFDEGNWPLVYGLGNEGARLLGGIADPLVGRLDWTTKNARATSLFIAHTLETADAMIDVGLACARRGDLTLIDHHELIPFLPEATRGLKEPFKMQVSVTLPRMREALAITVVPDRLFSLAFPDGTRHNFALELDRGTMDIKARQLIGKSSFRRKLIGYWEAWRQERHRALWGFRSFRVLTITPSQARLDNMIATQRQVTASDGSNLFLFTTPERLREAGPLGPAWTTGKGSNVALP